MIAFTQMGLGNSWWIVRFTRTDGNGLAPPGDATEGQLGLFEGQRTDGREELARGSSAWVACSSEG